MYGNKVRQVRGKFSINCALKILWKKFLLICFSFTRHIACGWSYKSATLRSQWQQFHKNLKYLMNLIQHYRKILWNSLQYSISFCYTENKYDTKSCIEYALAYMHHISCDSYLSCFFQRKQVLMHWVHTNSLEKVSHGISVG